MGYYDNVKDDVKGSNDSSKPNFDTLRKAAEETTESADEREGDDTDIEVLEDGLERGSGKSSSSGMKELDSGDASQNTKKAKNEATSTETNVSADMSGVEEKLDRIIEQNQRMIEILESFGS